METAETRAKLANAIRSLQSSGDTASIPNLVSAYKAKYQTTAAPITPSVPISNAQAGANQAANLVFKPIAPIIGNSIKDAFNSGVNQTKEGYNQAKNATNPLELLEGGGKLAAGAISSLFSPLAPVFAPISSASNYVGDKVGDIPEVQKFAMSRTGQNVTRGVEDLANINTIAGGVAGTMELAPKINAGIKTLDTNLGKVRGKVLSTTPGGVKINEMISPKPTPKQAQIAQLEGRLYQGKSPSLFREGTSDKIATSNKTFNATQTILDKIPNASKMSPAELYTAVDNNITTIAENLKPQMQAVPIKPETIEKINTDWESLKKNQIEDAPATEEPNVMKRQGKFEAFLKKSESGNINDLWETRKAYDNSIPDGVKKANSFSSESLQLQKDEWLQNRTVLNNAINDNVSGMGATSQKAFSDMSNLYEAKTNLTAKTKVNEAALSKVNQFLKDNPTTAKILGGATIYEILKHLGLKLPLGL